MTHLRNIENSIEGLSAREPRFALTGCSRIILGFSRTSFAAANWLLKPSLKVSSEERLLWRARLGVFRATGRSCRGGDIKVLILAWAHEPPLLMLDIAGLCCRNSSWRSMSRPAARRKKNWNGRSVCTTLTVTALSICKKWRRSSRYRIPWIMHALRFISTYLHSTANSSATGCGIFYHLTSVLPIDQWGTRDTIYRTWYIHIVCCVHACAAHAPSSCYRAVNL